MFSPLTSVTPWSQRKDVTADTLIKTGAGVAVAILVGNHTNGKIKLWDNILGTGSDSTYVVMHQYTYAAGSQIIPLYGAFFVRGLYATTEGTVQNVTVLFN